MGRVAGAEQTRRRPRPRRSREDILDAAARIFHAKGYDSASVQDIADELGILKGSVYYHVRSKEDMLFEILLREHENLLEHVVDVPSLPGPALGKVREFVTRHVEHCARNLVGTGVFFRDFRSLSDERRQTIVGKRDEYEEVLRSLLREGRGTGSVCPDLDPGLTGREIVGMLNWIYQWYNPEGPLSPEELGETMADLVVFAVACDPETHVPGHRRRFAPRPLPDQAGPDGVAVATLAAEVTAEDGDEGSGHGDGRRRATSWRRVFGDRG